jgi:hypothetical protein
MFYIVMHHSVARQGPVNISLQHTIKLNNKASIARQLSGKQASSTIQAVFRCVHGEFM